MSEVNYRQILEDNITELKGWLAHNRMSVKVTMQQLKKYETMLAELDSLKPVDHMEKLAAGE